MIENKRLSKTIVSWRFGMKKRELIIIMFICLFVVGCKIEDYKYPVGKDSFVVVGDGRFQILSGPTSYSLWDQTEDDALLETVISYYDNGDGKLYVRGNQRYVIVNYNNNIYSEYDEIHLKQIPQGDLEIFQSDKMMKIPQIETRPNNNGVIYIND